MGASTIRCFIAIELPEDVHRELDAVIARLKEQVKGADVKWVSASSIHLTLKFLGEVTEDHIDQVSHLLTATCVPATPMRLRITSLGMFTSRGVPRVVWARISGDAERLATLATSIDEALGRAGFERERRPFAPHLTLARVRPEADGRTAALLRSAVEDTQLPQDLLFDAREISLMRSQLTPGGAIYSRIAQVQLTEQPISR
jgi:RNA 2',3'-cyclic 3'-phosphodiesterase